MSSKGVFLDVVGLSYRCGGLEGSTTADYEFSYEPGTVVSFFIGPLVLEETVGKAVVTVSDLVFGEPSISDPSLLIRARLLYSLTPGLGFERPIIIDAKVRRNRPAMCMCACSSLTHAVLAGSRHHRKICLENQSRRSQSIRHGANTIPNL